jgi:hypothetical protein
MLMNLALYLHLLALLAAFSGSAVNHYLHARQRRSSTAEEALGHAEVMQSVARVFPAASLLLLASGFYMAWRLDLLSTGWIWVAVVGLVLIGVVGDGVVGKHQKELAQELGRNGLSVKARALLDSPVGRVAPVTVDTLVLGVVWVMVTEPSTIESVLTLVVAIIVGVAVPLALMRRNPAPKVAG